MHPEIARSLTQTRVADLRRLDGPPLPYDRARTRVVRRGLHAA